MFNYYWPRFSHVCFNLLKKQLTAHMAAFNAFCFSISPSRSGAQRTRCCSPSPFLPAPSMHRIWGKRSKGRFLFPERSEHPVLACSGQWSSAVWGLSGTLPPRSALWPAAAHSSAGWLPSEGWAVVLTTNRGSRSAEPQLQVDGDTGVALRPLYVQM